LSLKTYSDLSGIISFISSFVLTLVGVIVMNKVAIMKGKQDNGDVPKVTFEFNCIMELI